ncbi:nuclear transport factor 2 family protein [Rhodospirillaceae bacterium KN72]|uniref:Nuclear transport factor 2 family protein n=1 Tax=Pacificispira spongiicola TaxID=2729598 RepID=A0A7Y0DWG4_9PROT|nr:nuclear transport factor 2 family protein [Pacificispira spongiicola]NMM42859.1 nuclear transport factor 2 family protein [Pacificispira spongiicola]
MQTTLPDPISRYFAADKSDGAAVAQCFTETGRVTDEKQTYRGRDAIRKWREEATSQYTYTVEPFSVRTDGEAVIVTGHVSGNFPGSPVDLKYRFVLADGEIDSLEIAL